MMHNLKQGGENMADNQGRGWHGDSEGHADAARERDKDNKFNWLPLLLLPVAFAIGWGANEAMGNEDTRGQTAQTQQYGIGGGPGSSPCATPASTPGGGAGQ